MPLRPCAVSQGFGFGEVEFAGSYGNPPLALCAETRLLGLGVAAAQADWVQLKSNPAAAIAQACAQGVEHFLVERDDAADPW